MTAIRVELELVDGTFTSRMVRAGQTVREFNQAAAGSSPALQEMANAGGSVVRSLRLAETQGKGFVASMRDIAIVTGVVGVAINRLVNIKSSWVGEIVRINAEFERLNYQMRSMSQASDPIREAGENVLWLRKQALDMPFRLSTINNAFVKLKATGTDPLNGSLQSLADGVAAFGGVDESFNRVVLGISQISGKGVIQMEELRQQLGEQMPTAVAVMARSMGVSMSRLIKDISTGTVGAKEALKLFFAELDRSYGGRARYMMQTFEGQLKRVQTQLENLALTAGGLDDSGNYVRGGLMDTLRNNLRDLSDVLGSQVGKALAQDLGSGLVAVTNALRSGIEFIIEYREEIINFGMILGTAFAARLALQGIGSLMGGLDGLVQKIKAAQIAWLAFGKTFREASIINSGTVQLNAMRAGLGAMMVTASAAIPIVASLGLAVYAAAEYFGVFSNEVDSAWKSLEKFGATTRTQVDSVINAKIAQLQAEAQTIRDAAILDAPGVWDERLKAIEDKIVEINAKRPKLYEDAAKAEDEKALRAYMNRFDDEQRIRQAAYVREQIEIQERYDEELKQAQDAGKSVQQIEEDRGKALLATAEAYHVEQIRQLRDAIAEQEEIVAGAADDVAAKQAQGVIDALNPMLLDQMQKAREVAEQIAGTPIIPKAANDQEKFEKGVAHLDRLKSEIAGMSAELQGANAEVVELQELLTRSQKYGHLEAAGVRELIDNLIKAQAEKELLDELMEGKNKLEADIERARLNALEKQMELREKALGRELTESERIRMRIEQGFYAGFGPQSETQRWLTSIVRTMDVQGTTAERIAGVIQNRTFGEQTNEKIRTTNDELRKLASTIEAIGSGLSGISFDNFGQLGGSFGGNGFLPGGFVRDQMNLSPGVKTTMSDLMGMFLREGLSAGIDQKVAAGIIGNFFKESALKTDAVGDNGTSFGLAQWHKERWRSLNQFSAGQGLNPSDPIAQVRFTIHELTTQYSSVLEAMKGAATPEQAADIFMRGFEKPAAWAMAQSGPGRMSAAREAYGLGPTIGPVDPPTPNSGTSTPAYKAGEAEASLQRVINQHQAEYVRQLEEIQNLERDNQSVEKNQALANTVKELGAKAREARTDVDGLNKNYAALVKTIESGKLGPKDINHPRYREAIAAAKELDRIEKETDDKRKARREIDRAEEQFAQRRIDLARQAEEAHARMMDPLERESTRAYRALQTDLDQYIRSVEQFYGRDSQQFAQAQQFKQQMLRQHRQMESAEYFADLSKKTQDIRTSLMSESQQRTFAMQQQMAEIDRWVERARAAGMEEVEITRQAEAAKAAIRQQYASQMNPMTGMMQQWGDLQGNLMKASTQWMGSLADGLTNLIMGTGDLRSVIQGILKDIINIGIKYILSQLMGAKGGGGGGKSGLFGGGGIAGKMGGGAGKGMRTFGKGAGGKAGLGGAGKMFGLFHGGGIVGMRPRMMKAVDPRVFAGAPRFHGGGVVGQSLSSDEVPIIARKGEGVFTPEQMAEMGGMGGGQMIQISAPISVQGSSGTAEQNEDLAKRIRREMEGTMRGVVADEMRKQSRPGNALNSRTRA